MASIPRSTSDWLAAIASASEAACSARDPESMIRALVTPMLEVAGDREAWQQPGSLKPGERHYYVGGCFVVTPDEAWHMLVGNVGFPTEQRRLMIPIDGGHPAQVRTSRKPLLLANTDEHGDFKQYLKSSRMGSSIYAPMVWQGQFVGQMIMAAQARNTFREQDLAMLRVLASQAAALWIGLGGPDWLKREYPPADGFKVNQAGVDSPGAGA